jgi:hypothetical protein
VTKGEGMKNYSNNKPAVTRNRKATREKFIKAVGSILSKNGFAGIGINAVAREAGVDKVLIYRYFGGLPQLISAFGCEGNFWPSVEELAGGDELETIRETTMLRFFEMFFPLSGDDVDLLPVIAIIGAGISYLVTRSRKIKMYSGIDLQSESGVKSIEDAIGLIIKGITTIRQT